MVLWTDLLHLDVFSQNHPQFQNTKLIQKLEDHIKQLEILHTLIKFQCLLHIQDKTLTISHKQLQLQKENQKKFQFLILLSVKLIQLFTDRKIKKIQLKKKEHQLKENQKKFLFLILLSARVTLLSMDKKIRKAQLKKKGHQSKESQKKFQSLILQSARVTQLSTDKKIVKSDTEKLYFRLLIGPMPA